MPPASRSIAAEAVEVTDMVTFSVLTAVSSHPSVTLVVRSCPLAPVSGERVRERGRALHGALNSLGLHYAESCENQSWNDEHLLPSRQGAQSEEDFAQRHRGHGEWREGKQGKTRSVLCQTFSVSVPVFICELYVSVREFSSRRTLRLRGLARDAFGLVSIPWGEGTGRRGRHSSSYGMSNNSLIRCRSPVCKPSRNQWTRCSDVPCV
jgi:hypothetical protein